MNIADIKKELSSDEKVLESAFKLETLYKKYKYIIWALVVGLILFFIGKSVMQTMENSRLAEANEALLTLEATPNDTDALAILKDKNPKLYELFSYAQASKNKDTKTLDTLQSSSNKVISDISTYTSETLNNKSSNSKLYKEMSDIDDAYLYIKAGKMKEAKAKLKLIDKRSQLYTISSLLMHYTIKAK